MRLGEACYRKAMDSRSRAVAAGKYCEGTGATPARSRLPRTRGHAATSQSPFLLASSPRSAIPTTKQYTRASSSGARVILPTARACRGSPHPATRGITAMSASPLQATASRLAPPSIARSTWPIAAKWRDGWAILGSGASLPLGFPGPRLPMFGAARAICYGLGQSPAALLLGLSGIEVRERAHAPSTGGQQARLWEAP